jgi:hypothetical protein
MVDGLELILVLALLGIAPAMVNPLLESGAPAPR